MRPLCGVALVLTLWHGPAQAQLEEETATRELDLPSLRLPPVSAVTFDLSSPRGRYQYEVEGFRRLIPLSASIRRCVEGARALSGEFHDRLDFLLEPSGRLKRFSVRSEQAPLQACLLPHLLPLSFPPFQGAPAFTLQAIIASPGARLGGRTELHAVRVYPLRTPAERTAYRTAVMWVLSPWSMAMDRCAELIDLEMGFGYRTTSRIGLTRSGRAQRASVELKGKLAHAAVDRLVGCMAPFLKALEAPPHSGPALFFYLSGTTTARWSPPR